MLTKFRCKQKFHKIFKQFSSNCMSLQDIAHKTYKIVSSAHPHDRFTHFIANLTNKRKFQLLSIWHQFHMPVIMAFNQKFRHNRYLIIFRALQENHFQVYNTMMLSFTSFILLIIYILVQSSSVAYKFPTNFLHAMLQHHIFQNFHPYLNQTSVMVSICNSHTCLYYLPSR